MSYVIEKRYEGTDSAVLEDRRSRDDLDFYGEVDGRNQPIALDPVPEAIYGVQDFTGYYVAMKRVIDVVGSLLGLVILGPIALMAMLAVFLRDGKNPLFSQQRVGLNGQNFTLFKIRTMCIDAEQKFDEIKHLNHHQDHRTFKMQADPRIIPVIGERLRRYSIDEFPQLFNVLRGEMSLVGPRPALPKEVDQYSGNDRQRLRVKPGLTCIWQVSGRGDIPFQEQVALDLQYIDQCSCWMDVKLIVRTLPAMMSARGAH